MKTLKLIFLATLFLVATNTKAQEKKTTFGVKLGLNVSDIKSVGDKEFNNTSTKSGVHLGLTLDRAFTPNWFLLTGLEYTAKGVIIEVGSNNIDIRAAYVQLPLCAGYRFKINEKIGLAFNLGPYFAYGVHGKVTLGSLEYDTFSKQMLKNFDCGITFGVNLEWRKMYVGLGGEAGLVNVMQEGNSKAESRNFTLSVGYKF